MTADDEDGGGGALLIEAGFDLTPTAAATFAARFRSRHLAVGDYLFLEGDSSGRLYVVVSGHLEAVTSSLEGRELVFPTMGPASMIGELTILDSSPRSASVRAASPATLIGISRQALLDHASGEPEIGLALAKISARRARRLSQWASTASFASVPSRVAATLLEVAVEQGEVHLTQQALGDRLGISRESVNKWLRTWERDGVVRLGRGTITIVDSRAVEALALD